MFAAMFLASVAVLPEVPAPNSQQLQPVWSRTVPFAGSSVAFSPDGQAVAFGHVETGQVTLTSVKDGKTLRSFRQPEGGRVDFVGFSPDGKVLETRTTKYTEDSASMVVRLWEISTGKEFFRKTVEGTFEIFARHITIFSPDRKQLAVPAGEKTLRLLDSRSGKELRQLPGTTSFQFSPDGKRLATCVAETVFLWDVSTGKELAWRKWRGQEVLALQFSGEKLLVTTAEKTREGTPTRRLWDFAQPRRLIERPLFLPGPVSPDGTTMVALTGYGPCVGAFLMLWDLKTATVGATVGLPTLSAPPPSFAANGKLLVVVWSPPRESATDTPQCCAGLYAIPSGAPLFGITLPGGVNAAAIAPDGQTVAAAGDKQCLVQRLELVEKHLPEQQGLLSPNGRLRARGAAGGKVVLSDTTTGEVLHTVEGLNGAIKALTFSPGGEYLAAADEAKVCLWTTGRGRLRHSWPGLKGPLDRLDFGPDGNTLEAATSAKLFRWDLRTGKEMGDSAR